jgi:hypothetical protein
MSEIDTFARFSPKHLRLEDGRKVVLDVIHAGAGF